MSDIPKYYLYGLPILIIMLFIINLIIGINTNIGAIGDSLGIINSLFSGLAFWGVILAILLQKKELEEQRKEIRASREAQQLTAKSLVDQLNLNKHSAHIAALDTIINALEKQLITHNQENTVSDHLKRKAISKSIKEYRMIMQNEIKESMAARRNTSEQ